MKKLLLIALLIFGCDTMITESKDCVGVAGGTAVKDDCGICDGIDGYVAGSCYDCSSTPNGTTVVDECGECGGNGIDAGACDCDGNVLDCLGVCGGDKVADNCGTCDSDSTNDCIKDECGVWGGDNGICTDCNGVINGEAELDNCGDCAGGNTGLEACSYDCDGNWGGDAVEDCMGECGGSAVEDECGECDTDTSNNCVLDCAGVENGNKRLDCNGDCVSLDNYLGVSLLGDGDCEKNYPAFNCPEYNCDYGDCGTWDGNNCMGNNGKIAIRYQCTDNCWQESPGNIGYYYSVTSSDPSIPSNFEWEKYYDAIPGTYSYHYCSVGYPHDYCTSGEYTTRVDSGSVNENGDNKCYKLLMLFTGVSGLTYASEYNDECGAFFNSSNP